MKTVLIIVGIIVAAVVIGVAISIYGLAKL